MNMDVDMDMERMNERISIPRPRLPYKVFHRFLTFLQNVLITED